MSKLKFLIVSGFSESLVNFRFDLIISLISAGYEVHAAAPDFYSNPTVVKKLESVGVVVHPIKLDRIGFNPFKDLLSIISLYFLMRSIKPDVFFGYTVKPVIFGSFSAWLSGVPRRFALISGLGRFF
jgi:UDP-N-acetylglucosamine:LPS N-acetylglucosamine transferase